MKPLACTSVATAFASATVAFAVGASRFHNGSQVLGVVLLGIGAVVATAAAAGAAFGAAFGAAKDAANARQYGKRLRAAQEPLEAPWYPPLMTRVEVFEPYAAQCLNNAPGRHALPDPTRLFTPEEVAQFHRVPAEVGR